MAEIPKTETVGNVFVEQYYTILHFKSEESYKFYENSSVATWNAKDAVTTLDVSILFNLHMTSWIPISLLYSLFLNVGYLFLETVICFSVPLYLFVCKFLLIFMFCNTCFREFVR